MTTLQYQSGLGNEFATEALPGALPVGQQLAAAGAVRSVCGAAHGDRVHRAAQPTTGARGCTASVPAADAPAVSPHRQRPLVTPTSTRSPTPPNQLRWDPLPMPADADRLRRRTGHDRRQGDPAHAASVHLYAANASMTDRYFYDADGELLIVPQQGRLRFATELGVLEVEPQEIVVIPRGVRFRVELLDGEARGYVCENFGALFRLPDLGPIGSNGLANPRDFLTPSHRTRTRGRVRAGGEVPRATCGRRRSIIRRSTSWPGTATTRRTSTTCAASTRSARSASITRTRRSSPCCSRRPTRRAWTASTS